MKIQKFSEKRDEATAFAFSVFDNTIINFAHLIPYDSVKFIIGREDKTEKTEAGLLMAINHRNRFIMEKDDKAIRIIVLENIIRLSLSESLPKFIENVIVYRTMIKEGLGDDFLCYCLSLLAEDENTTNKSLDGFLEASSIWLGFCGQDNYSSLMLRDIVRKKTRRNEYEPRSRKLFSLLKKELTKRIIDDAIKEYEAIRCRL